MSLVPDTGRERLSDRHYIVLLLRLLVDAEGRIVHGDAGGPEEHATKVERWGHFHGPDNMLGAVQAWLSSENGPGRGLMGQTQEGNRKIMKRLSWIGWLLKFILAPASTGDRVIDAIPSTPEAQWDTFFAVTAPQAPSIPSNPAAYPSS